MSDYPRRPPFFAMKFGRLLAKCCLANELGPDVYTLLRVIADTEDARGYRDAPTFWNDQLAPMVGCRSVDTLARVRARAVAAGWLAYAPGAKGRPGRYWVVVPARFEGVADGASDERAGDYLRTGAEESGVCETDTSAPVRKNSRGIDPTDPVFLRTGAEENAIPPHGCGSIRGECAEHPSYSKKEEEGAHSPDTSAPDRKTAARKSAGDPSAVPIPADLATPAFLAVWGEWQAERKARRKPLTERAARMQLEALAPLGAAGAVACVTASIANGWQGLFPDKFRGVPPPAADPPRPAVRFDPTVFDTRRYAPLTTGGKA